MIVWHQAHVQGIQGAIREERHQQREDGAGGRSIRAQAVRVGPLRESVPAAHMGGRAPALERRRLAARASGEFC